MPADKLSCLLTQFMLSGAPSCQLASFHAHWRTPTDTFSWPLTQIHAHWHVYMPSDVLSCPLARFHAHWHVFMLTDMSTCPLTFLHAYWQNFTLTEGSSCPRTRLYAEWQPFMHKIIRIMCIDSDNNVWWKLRKISNFFAPAALKKCRFGGLMLLYSWYLYLLYR